MNVTLLEIDEITIRQKYWDWGWYKRITVSKAGVVVYRDDFLPSQFALEEKIKLSKKYNIGI